MNVDKIATRRHMSDQAWESLASATRWSLSMLEDMSTDVVNEITLDNDTLYIRDKVNEVTIDIRGSEYDVLVESTEPGAATETQ